MLEVRDLVVRYGTATALDEVSLDVGPGEMVALVGANGAGKSTLVNTLSGIVRPSAGVVRLDGRLAQVPEGRQLFASLTVETNLRLGAWGLARARRDPARIYALFPDLVALRGRPAGSLSGGQQQMVAVGRALMADPDLLAVDELSLGLAPMVVRDLAEHLTQLNRERGLAVLLIEQETTLAFSLCSRAYVLEAGRVVASGPSASLREDPAVVSAYLGGLPG
ncbi:ABC transporter ATP-binding protein [Cryptosporangium phraense]|uniref:ABC transporter ATP-binding protein n=1 Tax=Cryptosporangium phraense TaxID=2593070 RepID=A0A545AVV4_9ACTN|nr:ABC transporter ATP-binding protein [Cryptosporangium phraense]TQS45450.1 ABC transporter ATP-binding protein [Cryptosporangium phraense]